VTEVMPAGRQMAARMCSSCPKMCRSACPTQAVTRNERHQPWGHARQIVEALEHDEGFVDPELLDGVYACATCSACTPPCHVDGVETPDLVWAARAAVHRAGATPALGLESVRQARAGLVPASAAGDGAAPMWTDPAATLDRLRAMATPGAELLLLPGCGALGRRPEAVLAAGRALTALGVAFDVPDQHRCCGMPALTFGDEAAATEMVDALLAALSSAPARRIAVQSPSCAWMLGVRAPRTGHAAPEVEPLAATLARALARHGDGTPGTARRRVAYHDPCYLARHQRVRDEPRAALVAAGYAVAELRGQGDTTQCSGQGGGLPLTHPDIAAGYLRLLVAQVDAAGVDEVVTGCASCATALRGAGVAALELAEAVAAALGAEEDEAR
jgi:dimethylglycine catabolism B